MASTLTFCAQCTPDATEIKIDGHDEEGSTALLQSPDSLHSPRAESCPRKTARPLSYRRAQGGCPLSAAPPHHAARCGVTRNARNHLNNG